MTTKKRVSDKTCVVCPGLSFVCFGLFSVKFFYRVKERVDVVPA